MNATHFDSRCHAGETAKRVTKDLATLSRFLLLSAALAAAPARLDAQTIAITGGTVYPVSGPKIENGTVLIQNGRIAAVGTNVAIPAGAERIDAAGRWITPGLVHGASELGLSLLQTGGQRETREGRLEGDVNAEFNVAPGVNPDLMTLPLASAEGVTTALAAPIGGLIAGQAVVIDLTGTTVPDMVVQNPAVMVMELSEATKAAGGGSRAGAVQRLRRIFEDAREYAERRDAFRRNEMQELAADAADLEALQPVLRGELPVYLIANRRSDIENALRLADDFDLRLVIWGGREAWEIAPKLAEANVPVVVNAYADIPSFDALGATLRNAAILSEAGVPVIISDEDPRQSFDTHFSTLRYAAGEAVRNGMSWDAALAGVTLEPARALGIADRYGSLEPGKVANVVIWTGDPFEFATEAERVFIRGREAPTENRQAELLERYRTLPPEY